MEVGKGKVKSRKRYSKQQVEKGICYCTRNCSVSYVHKLCGKKS